MSTTTLERFTTHDTDESYAQYRAIHTGAILALVLGVLSVSTVFTAANSLEATLMVAPIPLLGMIVSLWSLAGIRRDRDQYTGAGMAWSGLVLSAAFLIGGLSYAGVVYATEVPEGYTRVSFPRLKPDELQQRAGRVVPPEIDDLVGQKVFIKGYIRPDSIRVRTGIDRFLLVRDSNECCFGDLSNVKYYDQIAVTMTGPQRVDYSTRVFRMGGILEFNPDSVRLGPQYPVYSLKADYAQ